MPPEKRSAVWIHGPLVDLALICFSWVPLYAIYAALSVLDPEFTCDAHTQHFCPPPMQALIIFTLFLNRLHRHYSLGFAYGDPVELARNRRLYVWAPLLAFALVAPTAAYRAFAPGPLRATLFTIYALTTAATGTWQVYHTLMQKYGFLRIYSAKLGYGDARVEKHMLFSWLAVVIAGSALKYATSADDVIGFGPPEIQFLTRYTDYLTPAAVMLLVPAVGYAAHFTFRWLRIEWRHRSRASAPKLAFAASVALIMATFAHSLLVGVLVLGFSHAFEYSVFVNVYAARKYRPVEPRPFFFRLCVDHPYLCNLALVGGVYGLTEFFHLDWVRPWGVLIAYANFTSILHFLFDGVLWRVRDPETRATILALNPG